MCGLVGAMGQLFQNDKDALGDLLLLDKYRGMDSTGVALIGKDDNVVYLCKEVGPPWKLFEKYDCFDERGAIIGNYKAIIGHNRAATRGKVSVENAHPFTQEHITGAHNGTLRGSFRLDNNSKFDVDSEALFHNLAVHGIKDGMAKVDGAYALVFYDKKQDKMFFLRNAERPLWITRRKDKDVVFWASEKWMLELALARNKVEYDEPFSIIPDHLYSFDLTKKETFRRKDLVDEGKVDGYVPPPPPLPAVSHRYTGSGRSTTKNWWENDEKGVNHSKRHSTFRKEKIPLDLLTFVGNTVEFYFERQGRMNDLKYLSCMAMKVDRKGADNKLLLSEQFEIRIFNTSKYEEIISLATTWKAKIKRVVSNSDFKGMVHTYVLIDPRSIEDVNDMFEKKSNPFPHDATSTIYLYDSITNKMVETLVDDKGKPVQKPAQTLIPFVKPKNTVNGHNLHLGFKGDEFTDEEYQQITAHGCCWCQQSVSPTDPIKWISHQEYLCSNCASNPDLSVFAGTVSAIAH